MQITDEEKEEGGYKRRETRCGNPALQCGAGQQKHARGPRKSQSQNVRGRFKSLDFTSSERRQGG